MFVIFIVLAVISLLVMITGLILMRKKFQWVKIDGTYKYKTSENIHKKKGIKKIFREWGIERIKGIGGGFQIKYQIPEFYKKLRAGDPKTVRFSLLFFGANAFVLFAFLAVGCGLVEGGNDFGWYFIGAVIIAVILVVFLHTRSVVKSKNSNSSQPD